MKKILSALLVLSLLLGASTGAWAANESISVEIDGEKIEFSVDSGYPYADENDRVLVPLRVVMEQYGCEVEWDGMNNAAVITDGATTVVVPIGKNYIQVDGETVTMDTAAVTSGGRIYLPIRHVLEAFGAELAWENGKVVVQSPKSDSMDFENIYINEDGELIFELANGNVINAGSLAGQDGTDGKDGQNGQNGRDGVSIVNVYVDGFSNLVVVLSNGRIINAGNIGTGGSMSGLSFADYAEGTRFYLVQPTGEFDVTVYQSGAPYTVHFDSVYYELTAKYDFDEAAAWCFKEGRTFYLPYRTTVHISGTTDTALAGCTLGFTFGSEDGDWGYGSGYSSCVVAENGSFSTELIQGDASSNTNIWYSPKQLYFKSVYVIDDGGGAVDPTPDAPTEPNEPTQAELIALVEGDWSYSPEEKLTVKSDGTITFDGEIYTPKYSYSAIYSSGTIYSVSAYDESSEARFDFDLQTNEITLLHDRKVKTYYKGRTWDEIQLTKDNFFEYFDYVEKFTVELDSTFDQFESAIITYRYVLKTEYAQRLDSQAPYSTQVQPGVKYSYEACIKNYSIDLASNTCNIGEAVGTTEQNTDKTAAFSSRQGGYYMELANTYLLAQSGTSQFYMNFELTDVAGTLYLVKTATE